jgi:hypothetical protein
VHHELDPVVLTVDLPDYQLHAKEMCTVVHVSGKGERYEIEIFTVTGKTIDVFTVERQQIHPITDCEVLHARQR